MRSLAVVGVIASGLVLLLAALAGSGALDDLFQEKGGTSGLPAATTSDNLDPNGTYLWNAPVVDGMWAYVSYSTDSHSLNEGGPVPDDPQYGGAVGDLRTMNEYYFSLKAPITSDGDRWFRSNLTQLGPGTSREGETYVLNASLPYFVIDIANQQGISTHDVEMVTARSCQLGGNRVTSPELNPLDMPDPNPQHVTFTQVNKYTIRGLLSPQPWGYAHSFGPDALYQLDGLSEVNDTFLRAMSFNGIYFLMSGDYRMSFYIEDFSSHRIVSPIEQRYIAVRNGYEESGNMSLSVNWNYETYSTTSPCQGARVELWKQTPNSYEIVGSGYTDVNGGIVFNNLVQGKYMSTIWPDDGAVVRVVNDSSPTSYTLIGDPCDGVWGARPYPDYNYTTGWRDLAFSSSWTENINEPNSADVWSIYDVVRETHDWIYDKLQWSRPQVKVEFPATYLKGTVVAGYGRDNNMSVCMSDRSVVAHEYGHCIYDYLCKDDDYTGNDTRAFKEGFAYFIGYTQTQRDSEPGIIGNYSDPLMPDDENWHEHGRLVAKILWDIYDGVDKHDYPYNDVYEYGDRVDSKLQYLWTLMETYQPRTIYELWEHWEPKDTNVWVIFHHVGVQVEPIPSQSDLLSRGGVYISSLLLGGPLLAVVGALVMWRSRANGSMLVLGILLVIVSITVTVVALSS